MRHKIIPSLQGVLWFCSFGLDISRLWKESIRNNGWPW